MRAPKKVGMELIELERRRVSSLLDRDFIALRQYLHRDLVYCHANGLVDNRGSLMALWKNRVQFVSFEQQFAKVGILSERFGLLEGEARSEFYLDGQHGLVWMRFLAIWSIDPAQTGLFRWHATPSRAVG